MSKNQIVISEVLGMLNNGKSREEIREFYDITPTELKLLFNHPKLKGKKTKKAIETSFEIVDDTETPVIQPETEQAFPDTSSPYQNPDEAGETEEDVEPVDLTEESNTPSWRDRFTS